MEAVSEQLGCEDECQLQVNYKMNMKWKSKGTMCTQLFYRVLLWNRKKNGMEGDVDWYRAF